jgi:CO/xanthine dehydrogenase FAD-binding subunit
LPDYFRPTRLDDALLALARAPLVILAGGTDHYPARVGKPLDEAILDITAIEGLREVTVDGTHWRIPACATWTDIAENDRLPPLFDGLKRAARDIGGVQIQNAATVCGNLCNASPAADGVPNLLALDAEVELSSRDGVRRLPIASFVLGNRRTARAPGELVTAVLVPRSSRPTRSTFLKLGARRYLVISIVMIAVIVELDPENRIAAAKVAVGACSAVAVRLPSVERLMLGERLNASLVQKIEARHLDVLRPIDDLRGTATYRLDAAVTLTRRAILELAA